MKNILIIRLSAIGDVVMASVLLPALKHRYPESTITWLAEPAVAGLLRENSLVDNVIVWKKQEWKRLFKQLSWITLGQEVARFRQQLKSFQFDIVLDLQGILKSAVLGYLSGCRRRVGLGGKEGAWLFYSDCIEKNPDDPVMSSEYRVMGNYLDCDEGQLVLSVPCDDGARERALKLMGICSEIPYAVICPFTTRAQKHWNEKSWQHLIDYVRKDLDLEVVVLGGAGDSVAMSSLVKGAPCPIINLVGQTSLSEAVAVIERSQLLIGVDTGLTHVGVAHKIPTIGLFGSTRPYLETPHANSSVIYLNKSCSPCRRRPTCGGAFHCMYDITPQHVIEKIKQVIQ